MRIKLKDRIRFCITATYSPGSHWLLLTILSSANTNEIYTVEFNNPSAAKQAHEQLLKDGYYDCSNCKYSN